MMLSLYWLASHPWPRRQPLSPQNQQQQERRPPRMHKLFGTLMPFSTTTSKRRFFTSLRRTPTPPSPPPSEESMKLALFLSQQCPSDILPKILAYCTPQKIAALSRVNWQWNHLITDDATWRILCEELYKWNDGDALPTTSWREYYQNNPSVPVDYSSIPAALATAECRAPDGTIQQFKSLRVLIRPGDYILREAITIQALEGVDITLETSKGAFSSSNHHSMVDASEEHSSTEKKSLKLARKICRSMNCRSLQDSQDAEEYAEHPTEQRSFQTTECASLILKTKRPNEPLVRVKQGNLHLSNLEILHNCHGMDIWNGNAAIQIQPTTPRQQPPPPLVRPQVWMESVDVVSHSGRGIVTIDGGYASIVKSHVHDCAATGIYVGGPGTLAIMERTDVLHNGNGNTRAARGSGIARGHSGVYLEQGKAVITDCNISKNSLTGISAVSLHNTLLNLQQSDLVANGMAQLEMPRGLVASDTTMHDLERTNRLAAIGLLRSRSGLVPSSSFTAAREEEQQQPETAL